MTDREKLWTGCPERDCQNSRRCRFGPVATCRSQLARQALSPSGDVERALASMIEVAHAYAEYISQVPSMELERHPYLPGLEQEISEARAALSTMPDRQAAINEGLEMAAKVAENPGFIQARDTEWDTGFNDAKRTIANAIRAMKVEK